MPPNSEGCVQWIEEALSVELGRFTVLFISSIITVGVFGSSDEGFLLFLAHSLTLEGVGQEAGVILRVQENFSALL